jgi:hypothetical protein
MSIQRDDDDDDASESTFRLGYMTDVEGSLDYFKAYVDWSNVLDFASPVEDNPQSLHLTL